MAAGERQFDATIPYSFMLRCVHGGVPGPERPSRYGEPERNETLRDRRSGGSAAVPVAPGPRAPETLIQLRALTAPRTFRPRLPAEMAATSGFLALVLSAALAVRLWIVFTHTYVVWPDETFQYLEPAHRLVFGSGVITWEFLDGIRSWFLPGILAGPMWLVSRVSQDPNAYVLVLRLLCVLASLIVPFAGFQMTARRFGPVQALLVGLLCALSSDIVYFSSVIMAEPLATDAALLAIWLGDSAEARPHAARRLLAAGVLFGLAASLRYQYAPVLAIVALVQHARSPRNLIIVAAGGMAVVAVVLGGLDAVTLGLPFQSVWLNYYRNATQGVSGAIGTEHWFYYGYYYYVAWGLLATTLLAFAVAGAVRVPVLAAVVLGTIGLHSLTPHKELRFVFLATACMPMLVGLGLGFVFQRVPRLRSAQTGAPIVAVLAIAVSAWTAASTYANATPKDAWHRGRSSCRRPRLPGHIRGLAVSLSAPAGFTRPVATPIGTAPCQSISRPGTNHRNSNTRRSACGWRA